MTFAIFVFGLVFSCLSWVFGIPTLITGNKQTILRIIPVAIGFTAFTVGWAIYYG